MEKKGFFYMKNALILTFLILLILSIPPVFASELNKSLTYDGNGNLITGDGRYREYNEFNQLVRVYNGSTNNSYYILEEYVYHPTEDRVLMKYWYEPGDLGRFYIEGAVVYINKNLEREYRNLEGAPDLNYTYYIYDETGIVEEIVKNASYYEDIYTHRTYLGPQISVKNLSYHNDYSGSVSLITNSSGGVVEKTFYEPFGGILIGGNASRYSYEGKEFDSLTEDYDFHFRKYDPSLMIFTQPDSVIVNVYDPQTLNRYAFERNNPYKYVDEDGKTTMSANELIIGTDSGFIGIFTSAYLKNWRRDLEFNSLSLIEKGGVRVYDTFVKPSLDVEYWLFKEQKISKDIINSVFSGSSLEDMSDIRRDAFFGATSIALFGLSGVNIGGKLVAGASALDTISSLLSGKGIVENSYGTYNFFDNSNKNIDLAKQSTASSSKGSESYSSNSLSVNFKSSTKSSSSSIKSVKNTVSSFVSSVKSFFRGLFR